MNATLKHLVNSKPKEWREAFYEARAELTSSKEISEYDRATEDFLMEESKMQRAVDETKRRDSEGRKRVESMNAK